MDVYLITHSKHREGGDTIKTYDGPLTIEGAESIRELLAKEGLPSCQLYFYGTMQRHKETAEILGITGKSNCFQNPNCGLDSEIMPIIRGDKILIGRFWEWLQEMKKDGIKSVLLVTSRLQAYVIEHKVMPGSDSFEDFFKKTEAEGDKNPLNVSGALHYFEI